MNINSKEELKEFVEVCTSINSLAKVMKACYNTELIIFSDAELSEVKKSVLEWISKYGDNTEVPLFISDEPIFNWQKKE